MIRAFLLGVGILLVSGSAFADFPHRPVSGPGTIGGLLPYCGQGISYDSYGRGMESVFAGRDLRPNRVDDDCYALGVEKGNEILAAAKNDGEFAESDCRRDFSEGRENGFRMDVESAGSECFVSGYQAGESDLDIGAREGRDDVVGAECVAEYDRGKADSKNRQAAEPPMEQPVNQCYSIGYYDSTLAQ